MDSDILVLQSPNNLLKFLLVCFSLTLHFDVTRNNCCSHSQFWHTGNYVLQPLCTFFLLNKLLHTPYKILIALMHAKNFYLYEFQWLPISIHYCYIDSHIVCGLIAFEKMSKFKVSIRNGQRKTNLEKCWCSRHCLNGIYIHAKHDFLQYYTHVPTNRGQL